MITLKNIQEKFLINSNNNELISQINNFIDVESYKIFLELRKNSKMSNCLKKDILNYINANDFQKIKYESLKIGSVISNDQICSFAKNYDQTGGIIKSKINNDDIFFRIKDGNYEYKIGDITLNVKNQFYKDGNIKCYIKTKENVNFPFDKISINTEVSGINGKKRLFIYEKINKNQYVYKGLYFCLKVEEEILDGNKLYYWIFTKNEQKVNEEELILTSIEKVSNTYLGVLDKTEIEVIVKQRVGHSFLKDKIYEQRKECEITHIRNKKLLIASHIKPWSKSNNKERLDVNNILLLSPLYDKLFDKGFISFDNNGNILVSKNLEKWDRDIIFKNIKEKQIKINVNANMIQYLNYHRQHVFI